MKPEILQIAPMLPGVEAALGEAYRVHRYFDAADRKALIAEAGPRIRGVATDGHYGIAPEILAALPGLEVVASYGVGYDGIDIPACKARGVRVTNTPDVLNDAVAELALGLISALVALPMLLMAPVGGTFADRFDRRRVVAAGQLLVIGGELTIFTLLVTDHLAYWHLLLMEALMGTAFPLIMPARQAITSRDST